MAKSFNIERETIGQVFIEPKNLFETPRFQHPYSWEEGEIEEFWETVFTAEPVFLGTIIFNNRRRDDENVVEIIDGQQRYLTIQILAAVIRDICQKLRREFSDDDFDHIAQGITASLLGKPDKWNPKKYDYYLTPGESIRAFFLEHIQKSEAESELTLHLSSRKIQKKRELRMLI